MKLAATASLATVVALATVLVGGTGASANTPPNAYAPAGSAWLDVPASQRVYLEAFGGTADDDAIRSVPAGISCTFNGITADGPFLTTDDLNATHCADAGLNPVDPIDDATGLGAVDLGFSVNFFGTTYTSAWPSTNGGLFFGETDADYDYSATGLAYNHGGDAIFPLATDQLFENTQSNFWVAQTTVDGHAAVVFSWERFHNCCNYGATAEDMTYQLVLIDAGSGDFNAQFNYSSIVAMTDGYSAPSALIDLATGVTPGTNVFVVDSVTGIAPGCTYADGDEYGSTSDAALVAALFGGASFYYSLEDASAKTLSLWSDAACTVPINSTVVQNLAIDGYSYIEVAPDTTVFSALAAGWGSYNQTTGQITTLEFFRNIDSADLENGQPGAANVRSLNSAIAGQFIIGQRGGVTVTDPVVLGLVAAPALAATGRSGDPILLGGLVALLLLAGAAAVVASRRTRTA